MLSSSWLHEVPGTVISEYQKPALCGNWHKVQEQIVSQFWRLQVRDQCVGRLGSFWEL